ncbi:EAL domain-containing protein [Roseixanthobacter glucoisosaccharinicivorans]|uniref:EAL domain-containing protein n=1 Tax=Roseixanthobacter glucoisosaccharinicivorans TaxID=3119923 RepID=UPI0037284CED
MSWFRPEDEKFRFLRVFLFVFCDFAFNSSHLTKNTKAGVMFPTTKRAEASLIIVFIGVISFFFLLSCFIDYRATRSDALLNARNQTSGIVSWFDRNLNLTAQAMRSVAEETRSDCRQSQIATIVGRLLRTVSVKGIEVRSEEQVLCRWVPPVDTAVGESLCPPQRGESVIVKVRARGENGLTATALVDTQCLLTPFLLSQADSLMTLHVAAGVPAGDGPVQPAMDLPPTPWWAPQAVVSDTSARWALTVGASLPELTLAERWAARLPLHIAIFVALGAVFWVGPLSMMRRRLSIAGQVRAALRRSEFYLMYLPTVQIETGAWIGVEALLRWRHAQFGILQPSAFIPWIEKSPLAHDTTEWVMRQASTDLQRLRSLNDDIYVGINVPPSQLADPRLVEAAASAFGGEDLCLSRVMFELTEREMVDYALPVVQEVVKSLRSLGAQIALDDFGVGYSNIGCLRSIRVDVIKVDKSFTHDLETLGNESNIVDVVVRLARDFGVKVIAEGVETESQLESLRNTGVQVAQGFLFSKPLEVDAVLVHLRAQAA